MSFTPRRDFLKTVAGAVPASMAVPGYAEMASPLRKQIKITDVKAMIVKGNTPWNMVKIETDAGFTGLGEAYWGHGVKDVILGYLRALLIGEYTAKFSDPELVNTYEKRLDAVTPEDVERAARKYLSVNQRCIIETYPKQAATGGAQ